MNGLHLLAAPAELTQLQPPAAWPALTPEDLRQQAPDAHWVLADAHGALAARCSLWWTQTPPYEQHRLGVIGHYAAENDVSARQILAHATRQLGQNGRTFAIGPMDGNTWRSYRLVTPCQILGETLGAQRPVEPPFFMEPDHPPDWPRHWLQAGFAPIARYSSALNTELSYEDPRVAQVGHRMQARGVAIRALDVSAFEAELLRIYTVSRISFQPNFLYTPLEETEFLGMYRKVKPYLRPELVLMATAGDQPVGFLFALPDWRQAQRGAGVDTVVIKTVAVLPGRAYAGLGNLLGARCHGVARELGFTRAIHALMHHGNNSRNASGHYAQTMRCYALFGKELAPAT